MPIIHDAPDFPGFSRAFLEKFVDSIALALALRNHFHSSGDNIVQDDLDTLHSICFNGLTTLEDPQPLEVDGRQAHVHYGFSDALHQPSEIRLSDDRALLHGALDDELLANAIRKALL
ncbi:hypothetical protein [Breoghania sp.]|uniref:hypothetical protein n=1 Tax=Breoghania sp. TaxID=2065378 RepID=UPI002AAC10D9|nr:hypothetical protein [Breoghania sp.]